MLGFSKFAIVAFLMLAVASAAVMDARIEAVTSNKRMSQAAQLRLESEIRALASLKNMERALASNIKRSFINEYTCSPRGAPCGAVMDARIEAVTSNKRMSQAAQLRLESEMRELASLKNMERALASNLKRNFMGVDVDCFESGAPCAGLNEQCCSGSCIPHPQGFFIFVCA